MSEHCLNLSVSGDRIFCDTNRITADSVEYIVAEFVFDSTWDTLFKTAVFRIGEQIYHAVLENDRCNIPYEVLKEGILAISVFGVLESTRATTNEILLTVEASGYVPCEPTAPSPDPYAYFLEQVTDLKNISDENAEQSRLSAENAASYANSAFDSVEITRKAERRTTELLELAEAAAFSAEVADRSANESRVQVSEHLALINQTKQEVLQAKEETTSAVLNGIENHNNDEAATVHPQLQAIAKEAKNIALGRANSLCFDTEKDMKNWLNGIYTRTDGRTPSDLKIGDNLYILQLGVPDYWWDGNSAQPLGAERPDLTDYYTKDEIDGKIGNAIFSVMERSEYDSAYTNGTLAAGTIYFVIEGN